MSRSSLINRNCFSLRTIFSKEESSFVGFTDVRKKGFPTAPIETHFKIALWGCLKTAVYVRGSIQRI
nr:hypothetical protein CFP56_62348 [Quercus suber]